MATEHSIGSRRDPLEPFARCLTVVVGRYIGTFSSPIRRRALITISPRSTGLSIGIFPVEVLLVAVVAVAAPGANRFRYNAATSIILAITLGGSCSCFSFSYATPMRTTMFLIVVGLISTVIIYAIIYAYIYLTVIISSMIMSMSWLSSAT